MLTQTAVTFVAVSTVLGVLAIAGLGLRLWCRIAWKQGVGADDWTLVAALFLSTALSIFMTYLYAVTGAGNPSWEPSMDDVVFALKIEWAGQNVQIASLGLAKISLLLFYRRIFITRSFKMISIVLIGMVSAWTVAILLASLFAKTPVSNEWNPTAPYNLNLHAATISLVAINTFFDCLTLALPLFSLRSLQMEVSRKLWIATIFSLGSLCVVASIIRLYYTVEYNKTVPTPRSLFNAPYVYNVLWAIIEPPVFILSSCFLTYGPILQKLPSLRSQFTSLKSRFLGSSKSGSVNKSVTLLAGGTPENGRRTSRILETSKNGHSTHRAEWEMEERSVSSIS